MSYVQHDPGREVRLPSNPDYWVKVRTRIFQAHRRASMEATEAIRAASGRERATEQANALRDLALGMILSWNLTDEGEQVLPLTAESIDQHMAPEDLDAVVIAANNAIAEGVEIPAPLVKRSSPPRKATK